MTETSTRVVPQGVGQLSRSMRARRPAAPLGRTGSSVTSNPRRPSFASGSQHGRMLGGHADQVVALAARPLADAADRQVIALGGSAGEHDLPGRRPDRRGDRLRAPRRPRPWLRQPNTWLVLAALPYFSPKYGSIASTTRGSTRVVAWLSR